MSASREKKLRQDQTASGYVDPKAEKELEKKKAEKRSNVLYSVIAVLFVLVVAASFLWRSNVISRNATASCRAIPTSSAIWVWTPTPP